MLPTDPEKLAKLLAELDGVCAEAQRIRQETGEMRQPPVDPARPELGLSTQPALTD